MTDLPHPQAPLIRRPGPARDTSGGETIYRAPRTIPGGVAAKKDPSRKPVLTGAAAAIPLLFIIPFAAMWNRWADPRGVVGSLAWLALFSVPVLGLICLAGAVERKERARPVRFLFLGIHGLWLLGVLFMFLLGALLSPGKNW